jgi:hypothetical protein
MDTPGFDAEREREAFFEIVRGIEAIHPFARITGLLYVTCINQTRFDDFDRNLIKFIRSFCGDEYLPRITFVTTFWTAVGEKQKTIFNKQLDLLQNKWREGIDEQPKLYQHGREYDTEGLDTGRFLDWFEDRAQIAVHGRGMISRHYRGTRLPEPRNIDPRIVQELNANTPIHLTDAGKLLGLRPAPAFTPHEETSGERTGQSSSRQSATPDVDPQQGPEPSGTTAPQANGTATGPSIIQSIFNGLANFVRNVNVNVDFGGGPGWTYEPGPTRPFRSEGSRYTGPVGEC